MVCWDPGAAQVTLSDCFGLQENSNSITVCDAAAMRGSGLARVGEIGRTSSATAAPHLSVIQAAEFILPGLRRAVCY